MTFLTGFPREILISTIGDFLESKEIMTLHKSLLSKERRYLEEEVYPNVEIRVLSFTNAFFYKYKFRLINLNYFHTTDLSMYRPEFIKIVYTHDTIEESFEDFLTSCINLKELNIDIHGLILLSPDILKRLKKIRVTGGYTYNLFNVELCFQSCINVVDIGLTHDQGIYNIALRTLPKLECVSLFNFQNNHIEHLKALKHLHSFYCNCSNLTLEEIRDFIKYKKWKSFIINDHMTYSEGYLVVGRKLKECSEEEFIDTLKLFTGVTHLGFDYFSFSTATFSKEIIITMIEHNKDTLIKLDLKTISLGLEIINLYNVKSLTVDIRMLKYILPSKELIEFKCDDELPYTEMRKVMNKYPNLKTMSLTFTYAPTYALFRSMFFGDIHVNININ